MERNPDPQMRDMARHEQAYQAHGATIVACLQRHAAAMPDQLAYTFLREDGRIDTLTYAALERRATLLAAELAARAAPGARMLLLYPSGLEFVTVYFACLLAGMIAVPATIPHKSRASRRLRALLDDAAPALILTRSDCDASIQASLALVGSAGHPCLSTEHLGLDAHADLAPVRAALPAIGPELTAFLQYTSGSTSLPKGVEITHRNLVSNADAIRIGFGFVPSSVMVSWLPLFHDMGLIGSIIAPMYVGFHAVLMAPAAFLKHPARWLEAITHYRGTCAGAPNFGWDYCAKKIADNAKAGFDLSSLEVAYNGSEPVRATTLRAFVAAFAACGMRESALFPCYGMAETTLFVAGGPVGQAPRVRTVSKSLLEGNQIRDVAPDSPDAREVVGSGMVSPSTQVVIVDPESGRPVSSHRVGEVWVASPSVARGYWQRPVDTAAAFANYLPPAPGKPDHPGGPFLRTGDLGFLKDGELFITGRLKDLIIINGRNVYPQDVEEVIERAIDFIEPNMCAAFSVEIDGQEQLAIVAEANRTLVRATRHPQDRRDDYLARIEATALNICSVIGQQFDVSVSSIVFVKPGSFPRTTSGKVQRARCKELALDGQLELVYVMPGSIFDRRVVEPAEVVAEAAPAPQPAPPAAQARSEHAARSRARADAMIAWLRQYAARRLNSRVADERRTIAPYVVLDLGNQGFFGLQVPPELGGAGLLTADLLRVMEQLAAIDLTVATMVGVHNGLGVRPILSAAAPEVQQAMLGALASGRQLAAFALTEPGAGSNPSALRASAVKVAGGWRVNAEKQWIGLAAWASVITVFAKAVDANGNALGTIALMVAEDTPGLVQGPEALTMGMRGMIQNTVFLHDAFVPDAAVLRSPGEGMDVARDAMLFSRLGIGAMCVGGMKRCAQLMARYTARREVASGRLLEHPVTVARLHDLGASIFAVEALVQAIAFQIDSGSSAPAEAYLACKSASTELFGKAADDLVQMLGGRGYIETNIAPQILRDARVLRILEGPTETLYSHLGATLGQAGNGAIAFIRGPLGRPELAAQLAATVHAILDNAGVSAALFGSTQALHQWLDYKLGELAASAMLLAAAESGPRQDGPLARQHAANAVAWARQRYTACVQAIDAELAQHAPYSNSAALLHMVETYTSAIGDIDQDLAPEHQAIDPVLRRAPQQAPLAWQAVPATPVAAEPVTTAPAALAEPAAATATPAPGVAPTPMQAIVHDAVMAWLRSEPRRTQRSIDFDTAFTAIGMDSLATVAIAADIENRTGLALVPELLYDYQTVHTLAAWLDTRRADAGTGAGSNADSDSGSGAA